MRVDTYAIYLYDRNTDIHNVMFGSSKDILAVETGNTRNPGAGNAQETENADNRTCTAARVRGKQETCRKY